MGFIFYEKSPRRVTPELVKSIVDNLSRRVCCVGVFVNENIDKVIETAKKCSLNVVQLHGDESPEDIQKCLDAGLKVIKGVRVKTGEGREIIDAFPGTALLLDAFSEKSYGGTGELTDWNLAREAAKQRKVFLSGGLNAENVAEAVDYVNPHAVDVCSGVESAPGKKDKEKLEKFFQEIDKFRQKG